MSDRIEEICSGLEEGRLVELITYRKITEVPITYTSATHHISFKIIMDSLINLWKLFLLKLNRKTT